MRTTAPGPLTGRILEGRYELGDLIARGGMGSVYRGRDRRLDRPVAVKVLKSSLAEDPKRIQRFEKEAQAAAMITDPHVVGVWDQGLDGSGPEPIVFLVMELVDGATLRDLIKRRSPMTVREMFRVAIPLVRGLNAAHRVGMIHRDVKPENVLISPRGSVKVTDFGLTHHVQEVSETITLVGSASYIAPELVKREPAGMPADNYSVGVMLYEMLTGVPPFRGGNPYEVSMAQVNEPLPDLRRRFPDADPDVVELIAWCCDKNPELRPQTAEMLLDELEHVAASLSDAALDAEPPGYRRDAQDLFAVLATDAHTSAHVVRRSRPAPGEPDADAPENYSGTRALPLPDQASLERPVADPETTRADPAIRGIRDPWGFEDAGASSPTDAGPLSGSAAAGGERRNSSSSGHRAAREQLDPRIPAAPLVEHAPNQLWVWLLLFLLAACLAGFLGWMLGVQLLQHWFSPEQAAPLGAALGGPAG